MSEFPEVPTKAQFVALEARVAALEKGTPPDPGPGGVPAPTGVKAVADQSARTITVNWDAVPGADSYTLYEGGSEVGRAGFKGLNLPAAPRGPMGDSRVYEWWVTAVRGGKESPISEKVRAEITGTTSPPPTSPPGEGVVAAIMFDTAAMTGMRTGDSGIRQWSSSGPNTFQVVDHLGTKWGRAQITGGPHPADIRAEGIVAGPNNSTFKMREGDELWFGDTIIIGDGYPAVHFNNVLQWKGDGTGSAPLYFGAWDGAMQLRSSIGNRACGAIDFGKPHRYTIGVRFASNNKGWVEVWRDGVQTLSRTTTSTLLAGKESYPKVGYYRGDELRGTGAVYHRDFRIGRTKSSVE